MRGGHRHGPSDEFGSEFNEEGPGGNTTKTMKCLSCTDEYCARDAGTCRECYEEASGTEEELRREINVLKAKIAFLRHLYTPPNQKPTSCFSDVVLVASDDDNPVPIPAHRAILASHSPVFKAMLEHEMEESLTGTIKICDVSYDALWTFVNYLYAELCLDEKMAYDLVVLAEKFQVKHLKTYCEDFLVSKLNWENALVCFAFAHQHNAKNLVDSAVSLIMENKHKLRKQEEYRELREKDPRVVLAMYEAFESKRYEAFQSKQLDTAAHKDSLSKP